ncbi:CREB-binding protein [Seminavis robusta]|uniref:CREB-binding protein n=1 Tax=Seminavis robusta TaxID=568900 RepID=A0A9N8DY17_9STRA|nr:CREB-binding protein [Seminavis robusta]|eukprot:Sro381_g130890.1 CREB-binding protein (1394) ;mRNA; f:56825-61081
MQHLQEQLQAQYGRQQQNQQQNHGGNQGLMGFPGIASALTDPQQAAAMQQAQFGAPNQNQQQWQQGLGDQGNSLNNNAALAMMQQQQQQQQQQFGGMGGNNMFNFNGGGGGGGGGGMQGNQAAGMSSAVDASSASSAQLAAFVGMGIGGNMGGNVAQNMGGNAAGKNDMMATSNIQVFLQQQQNQQQNQQIPGMGGNSLHGMGLNQQQQSMMGGGNQQAGMGNPNGGNASAQMLLQQQLAKLQRQFQGQQDNHQPQGGGMDAASHRGSEAASSLLQGQQQLLQQMRQRGSTTSLQQIQQQRGSATGAQLQQHMQQHRGSTNSTMQQQMAQQQRQMAQRGSNANLLAQQSQRGSSASLHQQMSQQGNSAAAQQLGQRQSALARLQQMAGGSSAQQQSQDKPGGGGLHRDASGAGLQRHPSQAQMHGSGSTAQLQRDVSKSQLQRDTSHASVHQRNAGMQNQAGSNANWMAPVAGAGNAQSNRGELGGMPNQFPNQNANAMQQRLSQSFGMGGNNTNMFNNNGNMSEQELLMQQLRQQQQSQQQNQQQGQQDNLLNMGGSGAPNGGNMAQNLGMNFPNLQQNQSQGDAAGIGGGQGMLGNLGSGPTARGGGNQDSANAASQKSFLDGNFAGGWQSNADLPDRRHIIFSILEVIKQMRPDTNKISQKLPHMAKSLEEHLYRSAQTKEEYLDLSTLKKRLQMIAHGLELHRSTSSGGSVSSGMQNDSMSQQQNQQKQLLRQMAGNGMVGGNAGPNQMRQNAAQQGNMIGGGGGDDQLGTGQNQGIGGLASSIFPGGDPISGGGSGGGGSNGNGAGGNSGLAGGDSSKYQDPIAQQKKKVIRQQQQRLLLLRHASKCTAGPTCKTKFCAQMVTLWKHMKKCRDKNCSTSHCLSSRCVLNHYRICKSQGRTSSCEVCGPVMEQIKRQETGEDASAVDPLTKDQEMPVLDGLVSSSSTTSINPINSNDAGNNNPSQPQSEGDQQQLQQLHVAQMKLQNQLQVLKQLQRQQEQLLQQQRHLQEQQSHIKDPHTQQGQQLQQQQALLQQLQQRCQQQQVLLQQELALQSNAINTAKQKANANNNNQGPTPGEDPLSNAGLGGPVPGAPTLSASSSKDLSGSKRGSAARRSSKGKGMRGGKGEKNHRQSDKDLSLGGKPSSKPLDDDLSVADQQPKRRLSSSSKGDGPLSPSMPEPARKMIKLEPQLKNEDEEKPNPPNDALSGDSDIGGPLEAKNGGINVHIEDHEAKKQLVLDTPFEGDGGGGSALSRESIEKRLEAIEKPTDMSSEDVTKECLPLLQDLIDDPFGWVFRDPVDPVALGLPDYFDVVKTPMHLELVKTKLEDQAYSDLQSFQKDCCLVFENSILYNGESSEVGQLALTMLSTFANKFEAKVKSMLPQSASV